jgi:hypothetical protein
MNNDHKTAHISGIYVIGAAIISGIFLILAALLVWWLQSETPKPINRPESRQESPLRIAKIVPIPQVVNKKSEMHENAIGNRISDSEIATFRFTLTNNGTKPIQVTGGDLLIDKVELLDGLYDTLMYIPPMNHKGHIQVIVEKPEVGNCLPIALNTAVASNNGMREFTVWFRSKLPTTSILYITGRFRFHYMGGETTSDAKKLEIHSDSWEMSNSN